MTVQKGTKLIDVLRFTRGRGFYVEYITEAEWKVERMLLDATRAVRNKFDPPLPSVAPSYGDDDA